jgi:phosphoribosylformylglycinamidine cyclo-ligase
MPSPDRPGPPGPGLSYRQAGVDIDAKAIAIRGIRERARATYSDAVLSDIGSFGGLFRLPADPAGDTVLVGSVDGVGTKLKVAFLAGVHDRCGYDLVSHCVNDILVMGAEPLFFMDYVALGRIAPGVVEAIVDGMVRACREAGCALLGGETAEMPDFYAPGEYDLAGFIVGSVPRRRVLDGSRVRVGDRLLALPSTGLHTNGYSLARRILFDRLGYGVDRHLDELGTTVGEALLAPHRQYLAALREPLRAGRVRALAHVTGGGLTDNLPRVLPAGTAAAIRLGSWEMPAIFRLLQREGGVDDAEMRRVFNLGIGMVVIVAPEQRDAVAAGWEAGGERWFEIGEVVAGSREVRYR